MIIGKFLFPELPSPEKPIIKWFRAENTLTVVSVTPDDIRWDDLEIEHKGLDWVSKPGHEFVRAGDTLWKLSGIVKIYYKPTGDLLATFDFQESTEDINPASGNNGNTEPNYFYPFIKAFCNLFPFF